MQLAIFHARMIMSSSTFPGNSNQRMVILHHGHQCPHVQCSHMHSRHPHPHMSTNRAFINHDVTTMIHREIFIPHEIIQAELAALPPSSPPIKVEALLQSVKLINWISNMAPLFSLNFDPDHGLDLVQYIIFVLSWI